MTNIGHFGSHTEPVVTLEVHTQVPDHEADFAMFIARIPQDIYAFRFSGDPDKRVLDTVRIPSDPTVTIQVTSEREGHILLDFVQGDESKPFESYIFQDQTLTYFKDDEAIVFEANDEGVLALSHVFGVLQSALLLHEKDDISVSYEQPYHHDTEERLQA
jgi:hypothetical protein